MTRYCRISLLAVLFLTSACRDTGTESTPSTIIRHKTTLKVASEYQENMPVLGTTIRYIADRLEIASGGMLTMKVYEPRELVPSLESLDAVSAGKVDASYSASGYWAGKMPAAPLFSSVPFGPETAEYLAWMFEGNGMKLYQQMYDDAGYNVKAFVCCVLSPETSGWFARPIESGDDLRGLKMRFYGLGGRVMEKLGVAVTLIAGGEIFQALERGVIDATEFSLPTIDQQLGLYNIAKYNYFPGWHQQATLLEMLINGDAWESLAPDQKMLIELVCRDGIVRSITESEGTQFKAMRENADRHGVHIKTWPPQMIDLFRSTWDQVVKDECAANAFFKTVYDDMTQFRENYDLWEKTAFLPRN